MEPSELERAVAAGRSVATSLGLRADDVVVVNNSDRVALRLMPCDVLARVGPASHGTGFELEVEVARRLAETGGPVAELDPRVEPGAHVWDGFVVSLWTYYEHGPSADVTPAEYAGALARLHAGFREIELEAPHFTHRVADAQMLVGDRKETPELPEAERALLATTLDRLTREIGEAAPAQQLLHGEPHPGNLLRTAAGPLFIDLETCCRGPVELDIAHGLLPVDGRVMVARELCEHYPHADPELISKCHVLMWAMVTMWRWRRGDQLPNGRYWRTAGLIRLRAALGASAQAAAPDIPT